MKKILWATVIYPTPMFDIFLKDFLENIENQTSHDFDLLLFLDCIPKDKITEKIDNFSNLSQKKIIFLEQSQHILSPQSIRTLIIKEVQKLQYKLLIISDFDEVSDTNRFEETKKHLYRDYDFYFNSFYITDFCFNKKSQTHFYQEKKIKKYINQIKPLVKKNFVGLGNIAIKISNPLFSQLPNPTKILAYDWFLVTWMVINGLTGMRLDNTYNRYRQHGNSFVGIGEKLCPKKLLLGIKVKKEHYSYFSHLDSNFYKLLDEIIEVEQYILKNEEKYIRIINEKFDTKKMCWWENIKSLEEIKRWI